MFFTMAPSDSGLSLGGILSQNIRVSNNLKSKYGLTPYLGPSFSKIDIIKIIDNYKLKYLKPKNIAKDIVQEILKKVIESFQGKAEFGQRSLGNRSIIADPRDVNIKNRLNQNLKKGLVYAVCTCDT